MEREGWKKIVKILTESNPNGLYITILISIVGSDTEVRINLFDFCSRTASSKQHRLAGRNRQRSGGSTLSI